MYIVRVQYEDYPYTINEHYQSFSELIDAYSYHVINRNHDILKVEITFDRQTINLFPKNGLNNTIDAVKNHNLTKSQYLDAADIWLNYVEAHVKNAYGCFGNKKIKIPDYESL